MQNAELKGGREFSFFSLLLIGEFHFVKNKTMKRKITLVVVCLLACSFIYAQPTIQWQKCLGGTAEDYSRSCQQTTDGGYISAGYTRSNNGDVTGFHGVNDCWIVKLDGGGILQWEKALGGTGRDEAYSIEQTSDGGYILAGLTESNDGDVTGNHGLLDCWVVKLDGSGNIQWQKCYGGTDYESAQYIQQTSDGGYVFAGYTQSNNGDVTGLHGGDDYWVVKLDGSGNIQWQKCYGGTDFERAYAIEQTSDEI